MRPGSIFLRGLAMGAADIVPGVSGGTIAFITGIYPRLLQSLRSFDSRLVQYCLRFEWAAAWRHVDGSFLAWLLAGILSSIFTLASVIGWLLEHYPEPLWALFFGLILASAVLLYRQMDARGWHHLLALALGTSAALMIAVAPRAEFMQGMLGVFMAGFIAICAMILPGISGSFILVLLGMYAVVLAAVSSLDVMLLLVFAIGAGCGLLVFSRLLFWLLSQFRDTTIAVLTGFLFGSLATVWPWKRTLDWMMDRHGELRPVQQLPVLPREYLARTGEDPMLFACLILASCGFLLVWQLDRRWGRLKVELQ